MKLISGISPEKKGVNGESLALFLPAKFMKYAKSKQGDGIIWDLNIPNSF